MLTSDPDCPFCAIVLGDDPGAREVYRDKHVVAFLPTEPAILGHVMVVPREHAPDIWSIDEDVAAHLARATLRLAGAIREAVVPEGLNVIQSNGEAATQTVFHLHVHLVPRWGGDAMGPIWPEETDYSESQKDYAMMRIREACRQIRPMSDSTNQRDPEDARKHLDFIQAVVTRMSAASSTAKAWLLPVVTAAYGYALTQRADSVALLGLGATLLFAYLDANYLRQEKRFRSLYRAVANGKYQIATFSLQPDDLPSEVPTKEKGDWPGKTPKWVNRLLPAPNVWLSWSITPFYLPIVIVGIAIACWVR